MDIWINNTVYTTLPWFCIMLASISWFIPPNILKYLCITYLYCYGFFILLKRR
jgi:hypothetical protein